MMTPNEEPALATGDEVAVFEDVSKCLGATRAVDGLSLRLRTGQAVALLGPNGAGKSTAIDMLLGLRKPDSGRIRVLGTRPAAAVRAGRVGAMLRSGGLLTQVTVAELVALVASLHPRPPPVPQTLRRAGVADIANSRVEALSGGQAQRVRFALAIAGQSDLLVLDEPTAAMDVASRQAFWAGLKAEAVAGRTVLFATHYLEEADQAADRILVISSGRLVADGTPAQIKTQAGGKQITFQLDDPHQAVLAALPALTGLEIRHNRVRIHSTDADRTLYALIDAGYRPRDLEVTSLGLEQAFLAITGGGQRTAATEPAAVS